MSHFLAGKIGDDLKPFFELAEKFAKKELEPRALDYDHYPYGEFAAAALKTAVEAGLLSLTLPESMGGAGQGMTALSVVLAALAEADAGFASIIFVHALAQAAIARWADKPAAEKCLKQGSGLLAFPAYAPAADLPAGVKAEKNPGGFLLSGRFDFLPLAPVANNLVVPAELSPGKTGLFLLSKDTEGLKQSAPVLSLGLHSCPVADVELNKVEAGPENFLAGGDQAGYQGLCARFGGPHAALALGVLSGSYQAAVAFAKDRYQGGKQIIDHDQVRVMLANMAVLLEVSAAACLSASRAADAGNFSASLAASAFVTDAVTRAATDGVQCLGGYGYMHDYGQEKRMRDAKQVQAMFGPSTLKRLGLLQKNLSEA